MTGNIQINHNMQLHEPSAGDDLIEFLPSLYKIEKAKGGLKLGSLKLMLVEAQWKADLIYTKTMKPGNRKASNPWGPRMETLRKGASAADENQE